MARPARRVIGPDEARRFLVSHLGLARFRPERGAAAVRATLAALRAIQLDPLDVLGTNADLVVMARVRGVRRGELHRALYPGHAFEHFAKERCILPADAFPHYRDRAVETPWWRHGERSKRVTPRLVEAVLREVEARGPITSRALEHRGAVEPIDWSGWKGTSSAAKLALEILWTQCRVVVAGREGRDKLFDVPRRALPHVACAKASDDFATWAVRERVRAAGLLGRAGSACWSMLSEVRISHVPDRMIEEGELEEVALPGSRRTYLAPVGALDATPTRAPDDEMRLLGPLDPLLWDRALVKAAFGFDYVWEVYKPEHLRTWGWYVCPLYHRGHLVGRIEARAEGTTLAVSRVWREPGRDFDEDAFAALLERHAEACGCDTVRRGPGARRKARLKAAR